MQTAAAEAEDFEQAAALDDRIAEASSTAADAGAAAQREEQRAEELSRRRAELMSQQQQASVGQGGRCVLGSVTASFVFCADSHVPQEWKVWLC